MTKAKLLPEWAPARAVVVAWPHGEGDWAPSLAAVSECYFNLIAALSDAAEVWVMLHPSLDANVFASALMERGLQHKPIKVWPQCSYDDTWVRDYLPLSLDDGSHVAMTFNGWGGKYAAVQDDAAALALSHRFGLDCIKLPLVGEGGAVETNGEWLLLNADCVVDSNRNPRLGRIGVERAIQAALGLTRIEWLQDVALTGDDTDGHIDTIARFTDAATLVYAGRNSAHGDADILMRLHEQMQALAHRCGVQVHELPSPVLASALDGRALPATYANFLWLNDYLFVPTYGLPGDVEALALLTRLCPNHKVTGVRCEALLEQHGSLHCATMQIH